MSLSLLDAAALEGIRPLDLAAYLRSRGWRHIPSGRLLDLPDLVPLGEWEKDTQHGRLEISVPRNPTWRDYLRRIREVLAALSQEENRPAAAIVHDVTVSSQDVVRLRALVQGREAGMISLEDGAQLAKAARSLMLAAACATVERKRAFHSRKPTRAVEYLHDLSMGQTEVGSFVLSILSPVPPGLAQPVLPLEGVEPVETHFNRRVTRTLSCALAAVRASADDGVASGSLSSFESAVEVGVTADLCEALAGVGDCATVTQLDVQIGWAPSRPVAEHLPTAIAFPKDTLEVIREAGRVLRERSPIENFKLAGTVVLVDRPEDALEGKAIVLADVNGLQKRIHLEVWGEDWKNAVKSMDDRWLFRCEGELTREGKLYVLRNARNVLVSPEED